MTRTFARDLAMTRRFLTVEDVETIQMVVRTLAGVSPLRVVDLGAGSGTTALAVLDERADAQITTIDIDHVNIGWAQEAVRNAYHDADWLGVVADAAEAVALRGEQWPVDLLLHDASHEREHVEADLRAWVPRLAPHGLVWVHDYRPAPAAWRQPETPGVREAVEALVAEGLLRHAAIYTDGLGWVGMRGQ